jgi:uncharacterized membrane protein YeiH
VNLTLNLLAVFVAGVSGALAGRQKGMDFFGMYVLALLTGVGGGILRSVLIGALPLVVFEDPWYLAVTAAATTFAWFGEPLWSKIRRIVSIIDAMSLGVFVSVGIRTSQEHGCAWWACICLGVITATFGGVLRDIARAEVPLIFRREIYATACIIGGLVLFGLDAVGVPGNLGMVIITVLITAIRLMAIRYSLNQSSA